MGDQVVKAKEWLSEELPEGWKVEIRVRKTGRKDRYYTDPVHGYTFRSMKAIDRYLLTGKLGRHVTKNKPKELECSQLMVDEIVSTPSVVSEKKELDKSDGMELCLALAAEGQKSGGDTSKRKTTGIPDSKETAKKRNSGRSSAKRGFRSSKKREPNTPFFILDPDKCEENDNIDIPNLQEIIDSVHKEKEGHKTVYVSAPTMGSFLGRQQSETRTIQDNNRSRQPRFPLNICQHINMSPANLPAVPSQFNVNKQGWGLKNVMNKPLSEPPNNPVVETKPKEDSEGSLFRDLFTDPCIDFAVRTLTGSMPPLGSAAEVNDCLFQQLDSSVILRDPYQN